MWIYSSAQLQRKNMEINPYGIAMVWQQSDWIIKLVALLLLLMSVASWYVIMTRGLLIRKLKKQAQAMGNFWHSHSFAEGMQVLSPKTPQVGFHPFFLLAQEGSVAVEHHANNQEDLHGQLTLADWLTDSLRGNIDDSAERMQAGLPILASIGSTAPFVGLFGTVWGIYHALVGIGMSGQASLDKVAGPVGESLIMTAFGLAVAIPAVLGYNTLTRMNKGLINKLNRFARQLHAYFLTGSPMNKNSGTAKKVQSALQKGQ
jgi:biopolymer transport protein ExbB